MQSDVEIRRMIDAYITRIPEPDVVGNCENCKDELYEGQEVVVYDGDYFCGDTCLVEYLHKQGEVWNTVLERDTNGHYEI